MGLLGMAARTAVIAGTATAVSNNVSRRQASRWQTQQEAEAYQQQQQVAAMQQQAVAAAPAPVAAPAPAADPLAELQKLADLKQAGMLTDEEFTAMKAKIINS
jgi:hypothetical protein